MSKSTLCIAIELLQVRQMYVKQYNESIDEDEKYNILAAIRFTEEAIEFTSFPKRQYLYLRDYASYCKFLSEHKIIITL